MLRVKTKIFGTCCQKDLSKQSYDRIRRSHYMSSCNNDAGFFKKLLRDPMRLEFTPTHIFRITSALISFSTMRMKLDPDSTNEALPTSFLNSVVILLRSYKMETFLKISFLNEWISSTRIICVDFGTVFQTAENAVSILKIVHFMRENTKE